MTLRVLVNRLRVFMAGPLTSDIRKRFVSLFIFTYTVCRKHLSHLTPTCKLHTLSTLKYSD